MTWFTLSILTAMAVATHDAWVKKYFSHLSVYEMSAYPLVYSLPILAVSLLFVPVPPLDGVFFWSFLASLPLNGVSFILYIAAIRMSPLSLTLPYLAFTPTFIILTGALFLNEMPNLWGMIGILTTCIGSYVLNLDIEKRALLDPVKAMWREKGTWIMLIVAVIYGFAAVIGKMAILHSSVLFFQIAFFTLFDISMLAVLKIIGKIRLKTFLDHPAKGLAVGIAFCFHVFLHGFAIVLTKTAYMISIKRFSIFFGIIYGKVMFREDHIAFRLSGAAIMLSGAVLIMLKGR